MWSAVPERGHKRLPFRICFCEIQQTFCRMVLVLPCKQSISYKDLLTCIFPGVAKAQDMGGNFWWTRSKLMCKTNYSNFLRRDIGLHSRHHLRRSASIGRCRYC